MMVSLILLSDKEKELKFLIKSHYMFLKINSDKNEIIVGPKEMLGKKNIYLKNLNLLTNRNDLSQNILLRLDLLEIFLKQKLI